MRTKRFIVSFAFCRRVAGDPGVRRGDGDLDRERYELRRDGEREYRERGERDAEGKPYVRGMMR
jgi:hypothetical protein